MSGHDGQPPEEDARRREYPSSPGADDPLPGGDNAGGDDDDTDRHQFAPGWFNAPPPPARPPSNAGGNEGHAGQGAAAPASSWQSGPYQDPQPQRSRKRTSKAPLLLGIGVAAVLIVGIILIATMLSGNGGTEADSKPDSNGIIAEEVSPFDFEQGQCFTEFSDATEPATVVTCETPHQAQLVSTFHYEDDAEFPGGEALAQKAEELCRNTELSAEANNYEGKLRQQTAYPQSESWEAGDRRVDCFIRILDGEITGSLIN